ncbi:MAG: ATP-dependent sacrificial sulfur transferase LarE [Chloroflexota bacterium]|nr:ATP-dependent sacrificial sulfur transferase LarE [Chloroflexota bacterium]
MTDKLSQLRHILHEMGSVLIAYSGGVDSTFLLKVAVDTLGDKVVAVTARSLTYPEWEYQEGREIANALGARHITIVSEELDIPEFSDNPPRRCYYCKKELFTKLLQIAHQEGLECVADGSNLDDEDDFRPGRDAARELGIRSPLSEAGLTKDDIRVYSKQLCLPTWNKPSFACLASRFPYGDKITPSKLHRVAKAEDFLHTLGFGQVRVRDHQDIARIEVIPDDIERFCEEDLRIQVTERLRKLGYNYITLDLFGYRSGSMNEIL